MTRREFSRAVQAQIVLRATNARGMVCCEGCGLVLGKKPYEIDHTIAEALVVDKRKALTAEHGQLLGKECCHAPKTRQHDIPAIARAKRREARHLGIKKSTSRPLPGSRASGIRKRMNGTVESRRAEGGSE